MSVLYKTQLGRLGGRKPATNTGVTMNDWLGYALGIIAIICVILPPKYDPAIRWKERQEGWHDR
jgi:hypothetical protein